MKALTRSGAFWFTLVMIALVTVFVIGAFSYPPTARLFPLLFGIPTLVMLILIALSVRYRWLITPFDASSGKNAKGKSNAENVVIEPTAIMESQKTSAVLTLIGWMVFYFLMILIVGFYISTPIFILLFIRMRQRESWSKAIIIEIGRASCRERVSIDV
jgi:hypothetical protein